MAIQISGAIFLHIPKTGGTWVTNYFKETGMDHGNEELGLEAHIGSDRVREITGYTEDLAFCFVRHPLTWYRSYWAHRRIVSYRNGILDDIVDLPFYDFLELVLQTRPGFLTRHFGIFTERCRFVGKQESLRKDLDNILKYLRIPYNRKYLYDRPPENTFKTDEKYSYNLALDIMKSEEKIVKKFNYLYIPEGILE